MGLDPQIISMMDYSKHQNLVREYFLKNYKINELEVHKSGSTEKKVTDSSSMTWMKKMQGINAAPQKNKDDDEFAKYILQASFMMPSESESEIDLLDWWSKSELQYKNLSFMARDLLSVQASSTESERMFSLCGRIMTKSRSKLGAGKLKKTICLNSWIKFFD